MKLLKRSYVFCRIIFLSVFATTNQLDNVEAEWAFVVGETDEIKPKLKAKTQNEPETSNPK